MSRGYKLYEGHNLFCAIASSTTAFASGSEEKTPVYRLTSSNIPRIRCLRYSMSHLRRPPDT